MNKPIIEDVRDGARAAWASTGAVASGAKASFTDRLEQVARVARVVRGFGVDDLLYRVGLERRRSPYAVPGAFGAGVLVGAGVALTLGSPSGREAIGAVVKALRAFVGLPTPEQVDLEAAASAPQEHAQGSTTGAGRAVSVQPIEAARGEA